MVVALGQQAGDRPLGHRGGFGNHGVGQDVLERRGELDPGEVPVDHSEHAAAQPDSEAGGDGAPGIVGLDQDGAGRSDGLGQLVGVREQLPRGVVARVVDDRHEVRNVGPPPELTRDPVHRTSPSRNP